MGSQSEQENQNLDEPDECNYPSRQLIRRMRMRNAQLSTAP